MSAETTAFASADDFFAEASPLGFPPAEVPDVRVNGKPVYVARLTAGDAAAMGKETENLPEGMYTPAVAAFAVRTPDGKRIFRPDQATALAAVLADKLVRVVNFFMSVNGFGAPKG
jgi:hypothetical protein